MSKKIEDLIYKFTNRYYVTGEVWCTSWGSNRSDLKLKMDPFHITDLKNLKRNINDGKFGVERIDKVTCDIYMVFKSEDDILGEVLRYKETKMFKMGKIKGRRGI